MNKKFPKWRVGLAYTQYFMVEVEAPTEAIATEKAWEVWRLLAPKNKTNYFKNIALDTNALQKCNRKTQLRLMGFSVTFLI